ncbi:kelch-like protein 3 isoform X2 [Lineus longissimus]
MFLSDFYARERMPSSSPFGSTTTSALDSLRVLFEEKFELFMGGNNHALYLLQGLNKQRSSGLLCDVIIAADNEEFPCHRSVLAACSPYFMAMFTGEMRESVERKVNISGIDRVTMRLLIDFTYTAELQITTENAQLLLSAANLIQINSVTEACCKFLEKEMDPSNCLGIHCFAEVHSCTKLSETAKVFALDYFCEVMKNEELLSLPQDKLVEFIQDDDLRVESEDVVLTAVLNWVKHDFDARLSSLGDVLQHVRLLLVDPYFMFDTLDSEPILRDSEECKGMIEEAKRYYVLKDRRKDGSNPRCRPRKSMPITTVIFTVGGEIYNKNYLNCVDYFDIEGNLWSKAKDLPFPRCHHGAAVTDEENIYISGGYNKEKVVLNSVLRYEVAIDKWVQVENMLLPRARHAMASVDGKIYTLGGFDGQGRVKSVEQYCPFKNTWKFVANMNYAVSRLQACGFNGYLYVAGGVSDPNNQCIDALQRYNPNTDVWELLAPMPVPRSLSGLVTAGGKLYSVGGTLEMVTATRQLTCYDVEANQWTELTPMTDTRFDAGVTSLGSKIYVLSGHDGENSFFHTIEQYDTVTNKWTVLNTSMPFGRCRFGCVALHVKKRL